MFIYLWIGFLVAVTNGSGISGSNCKGGGITGFAVSVVLAVAVLRKL